MAQRGSGRASPAPTGARSQTTTQQGPSRTMESDSVPMTLRLRGHHNATGRSVQWAEDVVDNEGLGRKTSKVCCIYHRPKAVDESSDESSSDSDSSDSDSDYDPRKDRKGKGKGGDGDDGEGHDCGHDHGHGHAHGHSHRHGRGSGRDTSRQKRKPSPNAYEKQPKPKAQEPPAGPQ